ncbi:ATP-grasp domain-containing protein [uncultured Cyclobacterium sp.]|uniref:ATP-grasp domain-containing protein n=1 Tax=uncultured Cyclobacterium sp. TaxID=453820 RepID=UPI0030ED0D45
MTGTITVLVTAIGSFASDAVVTALQSRANTRVIGCDIYPGNWHAVTGKYNAFYQVPLVTRTEAYLEKIESICKEEAIDFIFPLTDVEVDVFNVNRSVFQKLGVVLCIPGPGALAVARNKMALAAFVVNKTDFPAIQTYGLNTVLPDLPFPLIAKPLDGRSSEGIVWVYDKYGLDAIQNKENYLLQEVIRGPIYTVDYVRSHSLNIDFSIPRKELLRTKNGAGMTVEIFENQELSQMVSTIGRALKINGCVNMEFIERDKQYYLIDINPRFSAGVAFSKLAGYDMVNSHMNAFLDEAILPAVRVKKSIAIKHMIDLLNG